MGSITEYLYSLQVAEQGQQEEAVYELWNRFFHHLMKKARAHLGNFPRKVADEEDIALSAFDSFCRRAEQGNFPDLNDRDDLWKLLVTITVRKVTDFRVYNQRQKRDFRREQHISPTNDTDLPSENLDTLIVDPEPDPALAAELTEQFYQLLDELADEQLQTIAVGKMEGWKNNELAERLGLSVATIERQLRRIRGRWERHVSPAPTN